MCLLVVLVLLCFKARHDKHCPRSGMGFKRTSIPKTIYLCYKTKEALPPKVVERWSTLNPDYSIQVFGDKECAGFLEETFGKTHRDFFNSIPDGPIKADFWRLAIIYAKGGVYADADIEPLVPLSDILDPNATLTTCSTYKENTSTSINPHLIGAPPGHPLLLEAMNLLLANAKRKEPYSYWGYSVTGALYAALKRAYPSLDNRKEGTYSSKTYGPLYLFQEVYPGWPKANLSNVYCMAKGKHVLNNRWSSYDPLKHQFIE